MADVTFEEEVEAWSAFCKKDGPGAVPVSKADVEEYMRKRYSVVGSGVPISQEELDLIFDYTCDACESYILEELIGRQNWDLKTCEDYLMGRRLEGSKIRYCSETVKTSILNLQFASRFDSLSRTSGQSSSTSNLANLILTNPTQSSSRSSIGSASSLLYTTSNSNGSAPSTSSSLSSLPYYAGSPQNSHAMLVTSSAPLVPSTNAHSTSFQSSPSSHAHHPQNATSPPLPPRTRAPTDIHIQTSSPNVTHTSSAPLTSTHSPHIPASQSTPSLLKTVVTGGGNPVTPPKPSSGSQSQPSSVSPSNKTATSASASDLTDNRRTSTAASSGKICPKISVIGFCSPRDCADVHPPETTMCKHLTLNSQCLVRGCPYQHPNVATRQNILLPIANGGNRQFISGVQSGQSLEAMQAAGPKGLQRPLSLAEWNTLRLTMVFHCPLKMRDKKCSRGTECAVVGCLKQHKKFAKPPVDNSPVQTAPASPASMAPPATLSQMSTNTNSTATQSLTRPPVQQQYPPPQLPPKAQSTTMLYQHQHTSSAPLSSGPYATGPVQAKATASSSQPPAVPPKSAATKAVLIKTHVPSSSTPTHPAQSHYSQLSHDAPPPLPPKAKFSLKDVTKQANHMNLVTSIMQGGCSKSGKPLKIKKLEEVYNEVIDAQYKEFFTATQKQNLFRPSEIYAFHGAPATAIQSIVENGFDMSKIKRTKFGHGLYCALDPNVSVEYCGPGNQMLLVRLITDGLKWVKDPAYYVVHNSSSMNPLYIITFEKP